MDPGFVLKCNCLVIAETSDYNNSMYLLYTVRSLVGVISIPIQPTEIQGGQSRPGHQKKWIPCAMWDTGPQDPPADTGIKMLKQRMGDEEWRIRHS